jgi:alkylation response protein AidB-like acyl-CoA dehydrogenase
MTADTAPADLEAVLAIRDDLAEALALAVAHTRERRQFGQPLAAFQAVQHHLAEVATTVDVLGLAVERAAGPVAPDPLHTAVAAVLALQEAPAAVQRVHQVTGAAGLYADHPLARLTPRILAATVTLGPVERHLDRITESS